MDFDFGFGLGGPSGGPLGGGGPPPPPEFCVTVWVIVMGVKLYCEFRQREHVEMSFD